MIIATKTILPPMPVVGLFISSAARNLKSLFKLQRPRFLAALEMTKTRNSYVIPIPISCYSNHLNLTFSLWRRDRMRTYWDWYNTLHTLKLSAH
jgi:hypothetical protein